MGVCVCVLVFCVWSISFAQIENNNNSWKKLSHLTKQKKKHKKALRHHKNACVYFEFDRNGIDVDEISH